MFNLNKAQKIYIFVGATLSVCLLLASIFMCFFYKQLLHPKFIQETRNFTIWIILGWCLLTYSSFALASCLLEYAWVYLAKSISYSDATLELTGIHVSLPVTVSNEQPLLTKESEIRKVLNYISDNRVKEVSLVYDLSALFRLDRQKSDLMKRLQSDNNSLTFLSEKQKKSKSGIRLTSRFGSQN